MPSVFTDIEDYLLRSRNRGAILANIFERYVDADTNTLQPKDLALCTREMDRYFDRMPKREKGAAKDSMFIHLGQRGYKIAA